MLRNKSIAIAFMALFISILGGSVARINAWQRAEFTIPSIPVAVESIPDAVEQTVRADIIPAALLPVMMAQAAEDAPRKARVYDGRPRSLSIPSIGLKREVIDVGIASDGKLDVPPNYTQVGWYKYGALPGQVGSAVLDGHVDNGSTVPGPFKRLREVKIGDEIIVTAADGTKKTFKVKESKVYRTEMFPGELVFHDKSGALLKIITCHGTFIPRLDTYDQRLIVTAELVK